jgi:hypothetical protein
VDGATATGRGEHQAPETDGEVQVPDALGVSVGDVITVEVTDSEGVDLIGRLIP